MAYTRPGVYVTESPLKTTVRTNEGTATAAFVGINPRGPIEPTMISSWSAYTSQFGDLNPSHDLGYAVYQFFANGGRNCYVSRAVYFNSTPATATAVVTYRPSALSTLSSSTTTLTSSGTSASAASTYNGVTQLSTSGSGTGATFNITKTGASTTYVGTTTVTVTNGGTGYAVGDTIVISGADLGGVLTTNDLTLTIGGTLTSVYPLVQGANTFAISGTSASAAATYTAVTQSATSGFGTGATFNITKTGASTTYVGTTTVTVTNGGTGYAVGDTITIPGGSLGGSTGANNLTLTVGSYSLFSATAMDPGTYGNSLTLSTNAGQGAIDTVSGVFPTFNLTVKLNGSEVESWTELSPDPVSNRYAPTIVNTYSSYVNLTSFAPMGSTPSGFAYTHATDKALTGGSVGSPAVAAPADWDTPFSTALNKLIDLPEPLIINAVGQFRDVIVKQALAVAATRGDSFVIADPNPALTTQSAISSAVAGYNLNKGFGAVYYPMLNMADPAKTGVGAVRSTFPGGAVAGMFARTEVERTVAKAPAGYGLEVRNALGLVTSFTETDIGTLYDTGINTFKAVPGAGIIIQGARTLNLTKPDKYIPVRRTLNYVKNGSKELTQFAIFEPNDSRLWSNITTQLNKFLTTLWGAGGLKGRTPSEAFYVVCDSTNNTQASIDDGQVNIQIGVSLLYPAEFIVINVSQWLGGNNTTENI